MNKIYILLITVFLFSCGELRYYNAQGIPKSEKERILSNKDLQKIIETIKTEKFKQYDQKKKIPRSILHILSKWNGSKVRFASHGDEYRKGCVVENWRIPNREITTILRSKKYFVMTYNQGGYGRSKHILFAELKRGSVEKTIWIAYARGSLTTREEILKELAKPPKSFHTNIVNF